MNLAKLSQNGQITVPVEIRRKLKIKEGDKVVFLEKSNGEIVLQNSSIMVVRETQSSFEGSNVSEDEILNDVMEVRYGKEKTK